MIALRDLQRRMAAALRAAGDSAADELVAARGIPASGRIAIYRHNVEATFHDALTLGFPAIARLVGADYFRQLAVGYRRQHPSHSGNLQHIGESFPDYIDGQLRKTRWAYLADVAAIEWAYQEILVAADRRPLEVTRLEAIQSDDLGELRMVLHPAVRILASRFPVVRIWRANRPESVDASTIDLAAGGDSVLLQRRDLDVEIHPLDRASFDFLSAVKRADPLVSALDAAARQHADPSALLARYVRLGVIVDFELGAADGTVDHAPECRETRDQCAPRPTRASPVDRLRSPAGSSV
jgi:hypothetical protein